MGRRAAVAVVLLLALCCVASVIGGLLYVWWPRAVTKPVVLISSPRQGEEVRVGEAVRIHAIARDSARVVRVELWADGELREAQGSSLPDGVSPFPLVAVWRPTSPGTHTINVRAFNTDDARSYASISLEAVVAANPDIIIAATSHGSMEEQTFLYTQEEGRLRDTGAIRNGHVYAVDGDLTSRPGPRIVDGLEWMAHYIHPEMFGPPRE